MSSQFERLFTRTPGQRRWVVRGLVAALIVVPLAVAGVFTAALTSADQRLDTIPAIVVNNDEFVTLTLPDGTDQPVLAGRQLVTQLTNKDSGMAGFDWSISNSSDAQKALTSGAAYAVLTIPKEFSASVTSLATDAPTQATRSSPGLTGGSKRPRRVSWEQSKVTSDPSPRINVSVSPGRRCSKANTRWHS